MPLPDGLVAEDIRTVEDTMRRGRVEELEDAATDLANLLDTAACGHLDLSPALSMLLVGLLERLEAHLAALYGAPTL